MDKESRRYWPDHTTYFLTGVTTLHFPYFRNYSQKRVLLDQIIKAVKKYSLSDPIYSIAVNHYHLKCYINKGTDLAKLKQMINGGASYVCRKSFYMKYSEMWQCSRSLRVISDEMDWKVTGYIIGNLLKHKEVNTFQELRENPFSSYRQIEDGFGEEYARKLVYSVIDIGEDGEGWIDF